MKIHKVHHQLESKKSSMVVRLKSVKSQAGIRLDILIRLVDLQLDLMKMMMEAR
ncbi:hypothetical protein [Mechercharimyces sp. CAU 1602]|uniref:hypothetical protein n=1 Tax=Mechercharimyces sp. CAU 1602 TaxID=2973933 RepID=UPI002163C5D3|nr:hypothetical protein [Mechercharimyces sp. CAU 1602]